MTMRKVMLRPAAEKDLPPNSIAYIAERSGYPEKAMAYIRRIHAYKRFLFQANT